MAKKATAKRGGVSKARGSKSAKAGKSSTSAKRSKTTLQKFRSKAKEKPAPKRGEIATTTEKLEVPPTRPGDAAKSSIGFKA